MRVHVRHGVLGHVIQAHAAVPRRDEELVRIWDGTEGHIGDPITRRLVQLGFNFLRHLASQP